jgi:glycerol-3-phosphate cytidylyltransferase
VKIGITCSAFDLFHAGHVKMLEEAKQYCDWLIVALQTDPTIDRQNKNKPVQSIAERYVQVEACKWVDQIVPYTTEADLMEIFLSFNLDVRIIGEEYRDKKFTAKEICRNRGIEIVYNSRDHHWSKEKDFR